MYHSTRGKDLIKASQAILAGLASDNGLYVVDNIPTLTLSQSDATLSYQEIAKRVFKLYLDDFTEEEIDEIVSLYNEEAFPYGFSEIKGTTDYAFLYLTKGPTFAFKDMALQVLPKMIEIAKRKNNDSRKTVVLTATSGDTGSAALAGFSRNKSNNILVLYPNNGCSEVQESQILSFSNNNAKALAIDGNFDDCQRIVKDIFAHEKFANIDLISANSINIGRLIPQIVYYYAAYLKLVDDDLILFGERINVSVPTGNFGNILAAIIASKMGLPVNKICLCANENNVLTDFINTGVYDANRQFKATNSPSMDILISSNLERFLYLMYEDTNKIKEIELSLEKNRKFSIPLEDLKKKFPNLISGYATEEETVKTISNLYKHNKILIDPHTAVAAKVSYDHKELSDNCYTLIVATASPYKFSKTICQALGIDVKDEKTNIEAIYHKTGAKIDNRLYQYLLNSHKKTVVSLDKAYDTVKDILGKIND